MTPGGRRESEPPRPDRGFLATLADVFVAPGDAFAPIAARPRFMRPPDRFGSRSGSRSAWCGSRKADPIEFMKAQMEESGGMERIPPEKRGEVLQRQAECFQMFAWLGPLVFLPLMFVGAGRAVPLRLPVLLRGGRDVPAVAGGRGLVLPAASICWP